MTRAIALAVVAASLSLAGPADASRHHYHACTNLPHRDWPCLAETDNLPPDHVIYLGDCWRARWDSAGYMQVLARSTSDTGDTDKTFNGTLALHDGATQVCPPTTGRWRYMWAASGSAVVSGANKVIEFVYVRKGHDRLAGERWER